MNCWKKVVTQINPSSKEKDSEEDIERDVTSLVNHNYNPNNWNSTPFPDTVHSTEVSHVSLLKVDPYRIYDKYTGEYLSIRHSVDTTSRTQVTPAAAAGPNARGDVITLTPGDAVDSFEEIPLTPGSSHTSKSTLHREPGVKVSEGEQNPLLTKTVTLFFNHF